MAADKIINSNVKFARDEAPIIDVVKMMVDNSISSVLIHDGHDKIVGIITERDIVRKFTLLDMKDKLIRLASTIMTRNVQFVRMNHLYDDIVKLHLEKKIRHFPILIRDNPVIENIAGIVSITDFLKKFIFKNQSETQIIPLGLFLGTSPQGNEYPEIFSKLGFKPAIVSDIQNFLHDNMKMEAPLVFDMDGFREEIIKDHIKALIKYKGAIIFATSNPSTVALFRKYLKGDNQSVAIKPVDYSYSQWFFTRHWVKKHGTLSI